jgi:hypothetical protein
MMRNKHRKPLSPLLLWPLIILGLLFVGRQWWIAPPAILIATPTQSELSETSYFMWINFMTPREMSIELDAMERDALALMTARLVAPVVVQFRCGETHSFELSDCARCPGNDGSVRAKLTTYPVTGPAIQFVRNEFIQVSITPDDLAQLENGESVSLVYVLPKSELSDHPHRERQTNGMADADESGLTILARLDLVCAEMSSDAAVEFGAPENQRYIEVRPQANF